MMSREQESILGEIRRERDRQDARWGGPVYDDQHLPEHWVTKLAGRLGGVAEFRSNATLCRMYLVELAALTVAALEAHDRRHRHHALRQLATDAGTT